MIVSTRNRRPQASWSCTKSVDGGSALGLRDRRARPPRPGGATGAAPPAFVAIEPWGLLAVHGPALASQQHMRAAIAEPSGADPPAPATPPERGGVGTPAQIPDRAPVRGEEAARPPLAHSR